LIIKILHITLNTVSEIHTTAFEPGYILYLLYHRAWKVNLTMVITINTTAMRNKRKSPWEDDCDDVDCDNDDSVKKAMQTQSSKL